MEEIKLRLTQPEKILPFDDKLEIIVNLGNGKSIVKRVKFKDMFIAEDELLSELAMVKDINYKKLKKVLIDRFNYAKKLPK